MQWDTSKQAAASAGGFVAIKSVGGRVGRILDGTLSITCRSRWQTAAACALSTAWRRRDHGGRRTRTSVDMMRSTMDTSFFTNSTITHRWSGYYLP